MMVGVLRTGAVVVCALIFGADGCGPAVHNEVAERARRWFHARTDDAHGARVMRFRGIMDRQAESLQAGVTFPDWGYGCLSMDEEAEAAHWTPFLEHGVEYLRETYSNDKIEGKGEGMYSQEGEQLAAFLLGMASHMVADELWHSLSGIHDGFIQTLANSTFGGNYAQAHSVLDVGGDFAMAHMNDLRFIRDKWAVPFKDILAIYGRMGISVSQWKMRACVSRQFYAMEAVKRFGRGLFPTYAAKAPMLTERLDDYYVGGLYSMAAGTAECWHALVDWFVDGDFSGRCLVSNIRRGKGSGSSSGNPLAGGKVFAGSASMLQQVEDALRESDSEGGDFARYLDFVKHGVSLDERDGVLYLSTADDAPAGGSGSRQHVFATKQPPHVEHAGPDTSGGGCAELGTLFPKIKQMYTTSAYSGFGTAVAAGDFSGSGRVSVAISAPYYRGDADFGSATANGTRHGSSGARGVAGAVFVLDEWNLEYEMASQDISDADPLVLLPSGGDDAPRIPAFGSSLAVVDFNADGIDDLAVGSSGYGAGPASKALGRVDVYLGRAGEGLGATPDFTLTGAQLAEEIGGGRRSEQRIGGFLFGEDVNNDGFADLLIGAPYSSDAAHDRHSGRLYGYVSRPSRSAADDGKMQPMGAPDFTLASPERQPFEWFGFSATSVHVPETGASLLLVGAPGHRGAAENSDEEAGCLAGKVYVFAVASSPTAEPAVDQPLFGGLAFAVGKEKTQLGSIIHVWHAAQPSESGAAAVSPLVLLGSPSEHALAAAARDTGRAAGPGFPTQPIPARGWQSGEVRILDPQLWPAPASAGESFTNANGTIAGLLGTLLGTQSPGHFGRALASSGAELWIGEPFSESEDGRVYRWRSGADSQPECFFLPNAMSRARLGQDIRSLTTADKELLVVTAPHDSQYSRLSGSVLLMERPIE
ncbi:hypothetical protein LPJ72_002191 [Coemansia sp. Benny D160-2]|nr:hypothetical protein LPJ72_002191 [Coemansia sp. Benny D160-2]